MARSISGVKVMLIFSAGSTVNTLSFET